MKALEAPLDPARRRFLPAARLVPSSQRTRTAARNLTVAFALFVLFLALAPWRQNLPGTGQVIAYTPDDRPQTIAATIAGRVLRWHVIEGQSVEAGRDERLDRPWERDRAKRRRRPSPPPTLEDVPVDQRREELLDEERVSLRKVDDVIAHRVREVGLAEEVVDEALRLRLRQRVELDRARARARQRPAPAWALRGRQAECRSGRPDGQVGRRRTLEN